MSQYDGGAVVTILCFIIGYVCGSILTAEFVARKFTGKGAAKIGTGNPGMANIMAQVGKRAGFIVLAGDIAKTLGAFAIAWLIAGSSLGKNVFLWSGFGALMGHNFPAWRGFKGGKGVTVTCTWLIILMPIWGTLSCIIGGVVTVMTGYLPLGAILIPMVAIPFAFLFEGAEAGVFMVLAFGIMVGKHYRGFLRITKGQEKKYGRSSVR